MLDFLAAITNILQQNGTLKGENIVKKKVFLSGKTWRVTKGFNLYVDISSACNASCPFCIAPTVGRKDGPGFFDGAEFALNLTESVGGTVQVVGGEPMISSRLQKLLKEIGLHNYRRVVVNTNGSFVSDEIISAMKLSRVKNLNISRHHYDERENQEIMNLRPKLPNAELAGTISRVVKSGIEIRLQCNLIKGYIDSVQHIFDYVDWCNSLGCYTISFSQVFPLELFDYQVPLETGYTQKAQIDLRRLVSEIDNCGKFLPAPIDSKCGEGRSVWGDSHIISSKIGGKRRFWLTSNGTRISLKTLSGYDEINLPKTTVYNKQTDWELENGVLAFAVLHSDGKVTASWDRRERMLFDPQILQVVRKFTQKFNDLSLSV